MILLQSQLNKGIDISSSIFDIAETAVSSYIWVSNEFDIIMEL